MNQYRKDYGIEGSHRYVSHMKADKNDAELALIDQAMKLIPRDHRILDVPCGGGRVLLHLAERGFHVTGADISDGMLNIARRVVAEKNLDCSIVQDDLEHLSFQEQSFDSLICFRFFHHLPSADLRRQIIGELCRVTRHFVLLSYRSPWSYSSFNSRLRHTVRRTSPTRWTTGLSELKGYFSEHGFDLKQDFCRSPLVHTLHLSVWQRRPF